MSTSEPKWQRVITLVLSIIAVGLTIYQYNTQVNKNLQEQFAGETWKKKRDMYIEIGSLLGIIAAGPKSDSEFRSTYQQVVSHYYGSAAIMADPPVYKCLEDIMHIFFLELNYTDPDMMRIFREQVKKYDDACVTALQMDINKL